MTEGVARMPRLQTKLLTQYRSLRHNPPTLISLVAVSLRGHLLMVVVFAAAALLCFTIGIAPIGYSVIGMLVAAIGRDIGQFRKFVQVWPVLHRIIDWRMLDDLLSGESPRQEA